MRRRVETFLSCVGRARVTQAQKRSFLQGIDYAGSQGLNSAAGTAEAYWQLRIDGLRREGPNLGGRGGVMGMVLRGLDLWRSVWLVHPAEHHHLLRAPGRSVGFLGVLAAQSTVSGLILAAFGCYRFAPGRAFDRSQCPRVTSAYAWGGGWDSVSSLPASIAAPTSSFLTQPGR